MTTHRNTSVTPIAGVCSTTAGFTDLRAFGLMSWLSVDTLTGARTAVACEASGAPCRPSWQKGQVLEIKCVISACSHPPTAFRLFLACLQVDKHKKECRQDCQDQGKVTKTVPFDKLTDCDVRCA